MSNRPVRNVFYLRVDAPRELTESLFRQPVAEDAALDERPSDRDRHRHAVGMQGAADARSNPEQVGAEFSEVRGEPPESDERPWDMESAEHLIVVPDNRRRLAIVAAALSLALLGSAAVLSLSSGSGTPVKTAEWSPVKTANVGAQPPNAAGSPAQKIRDDLGTPEPDRPHAVRSEAVTGFSLSSMQPTSDLIAARPTLMENRSGPAPAPVDTHLPTTDVTAEPAAHAPIGGYLVQLSSQRSEAAAQATSRMMQMKYREFFRSRHPFVRRSDTGKHGVYYRGLVGPFASAQEAKEFCGRLKAAGADCIVQHD